jgi:sugar lactone lactonase YvrE
MGRAPAPGEVMETGSGLTALAVSAQGELAAGMEDGVYLLAPGAAPRRVATATRPAALAFRRADLFVADTGADRVLLVESYATNPAASIFAGGVETPVGVQVSEDGKRLYVAGAKARVLNAYDVAGRFATGQAQLDFTPSEMRAFGGRDIWLLNSGSGGLDPLCVGTGAGEPAAWFVPAGREQ